jgi:cysteinyl-tRNA synthetase
MVEAVAGTGSFARRVMHVGAVHQDGAKMAKSTGNLTLVSDLLDQHPPAAVRLLLLDRIWSRSWEFHAADLAVAAARLDRVYAAAGRTTGSGAAVEAVGERLLDDLDVPGALDIAETEGGAAARQLLATLSLS